MEQGLFSRMKSLMENFMQRNKRAIFQNASHNMTSMVKTLFDSAISKVELIKQQSFRDVNLMNSCFWEVPIDNSKIRKILLLQLESIEIEVKNAFTPGILGVEY